MAVERNPRPEDKALDLAEQTLRIYLMDGFPEGVPGQDPTVWAGKLNVRALACKVVYCYEKAGGQMAKKPPAA